MKILVTGAKGFVGRNLVENLKNIRDEKNRTRPELKIDEVYEYDITSTYDDLEEYVRVSIGAHPSVGEMSVVVTDSLLKNTEINREELREAARKNLEEHTVIRGMQEMLEEMLGMDEDIRPAVPETIYVATNDKRLHGAAVMLLDNLLESFCKEHGFEEVLIIPSSIHEVLLVDSKTLSEEEINGMIRQVNREQVDEWERLSDHAYKYIAAAVSAA